jgi:hypothetical protein
MIALAILATVAAAVWALLVLFANGMSSAPSVRFQGGLSIAIGFGLALALWIAWGVG